MNRKGTAGRLILIQQIQKGKDCEKKKKRVAEYVTNEVNIKRILPYYSAGDIAAGNALFHKGTGRFSHNGLLFYRHLRHMRNRLDPV